MKIIHNTLTQNVYLSLCISMYCAKATLCRADNNKPFQVGLTLAAGLLCGLVTLSIRLSVCILLSMLQTELMAHFKGLTYSPHNTHGLCLTGKERREREADRQTERTEWRI